MPAFLSEIEFWGLLIFLCAGVSVGLLAAMYLGGRAMAGLVDRAVQDKAERKQQD